MSILQCKIPYLTKYKAYTSRILAQGHRKYIYLILTLMFFFSMSNHLFLCPTLFLNCVCFVRLPHVICIVNNISSLDELF